MHELVSQKTYKKFVEARKASFAYGNKDISDTFPSDQPYSGGWNLIILLPQQILTVPKHVYLSVNQESREVFISNGPKKEDPFTQVDLLDSEEDKVQELILRLRRSLSIPHRESLANKLLTLFNDAKEEVPTSLGIAVGSLRNFYNFLQLHTNLKCPTISLTPDYNIYASWRSDQKIVFSVHFLPTGDVHFVIFKPNNRHPERQIRISGTATTDILMETVAPYAVRDWISE